MRIIANNISNNGLSMHGTLNIWSNKQTGPLTERSIKKIETIFSKRTKEHTEKMDVMLFNRYGVENAQSDKLVFTDNDYIDSANINIKNYSDENYLLEEFIDAYNVFRQIKELRESIRSIFK